MLNKITHAQLHDRLEVFKMAGLTDGRGWDYAIPQSMFDELLKMGIESPGSWFVTDCTEICPKLRHVGEAVFIILEHRSKVNEEQFMHFFEHTQQGNGSEIENEFRMFYSDDCAESIRAECDAGFITFGDLQGIYNAGFRRAQEIKHKEHMINIDDLRNLVNNLLACVMDLAKKIEGHLPKVSWLFDQAKKLGFDVPSETRITNLIESVEFVDSEFGPSRIVVFTNYNSLRPWVVCQCVNKGRRYLLGKSFYHPTDALRHFADVCLERATPPDWKVSQ